MIVDFSDVQIVYKLAEQVTPNGPGFQGHCILPWQTATSTTTGSTESWQIPKKWYKAEMYLKW